MVRRAGIPTGEEGRERIEIMVGIDLNVSYHHDDVLQYFSFNYIKYIWGKWKMAG